MMLKGYFFLIAALSWLVGGWGWDGIFNKLVLLLGMDARCGAKRVAEAPF